MQDKQAFAVFNNDRNLVSGRCFGQNERTFTAGKNIMLINRIKRWDVTPESTRSFDANNTARELLV